MFHQSLAASPGSLKGAILFKSIAAGLPGFPPFRTVFDDPIRQRPLEADIPAGFFGLYPLVLQDLLAFRLEFPVQRGILQ